LVEGLADANIHQVRHLIAHLLKWHNSIKMIMAQLEHAITEVLHGNGYNKEEPNLGHLTLLLRGCKCLFAVSKALGLLSVNTVQ
ncbi:hypothetical protein BDN71DRAFT_1376103, partial [Pleurotus eryngii]